MLIKDLSKPNRKKIISILEKNGFKVKDEVFRIVFSKEYRTFNLNSTDLKDPYFLSTWIDIDSFLEKNFFLKTKHTKSYQDKRFNESMDLEESLGILNWELVESYGIKEFDSNPTVEEPIADSIYYVKIKDSPHIIVDEVVYEGEPISLLALIKPTAMEAMKALSQDNIISELFKD